MKTGIYGRYLEPLSLPEHPEGLVRSDEQCLRYHICPPPVIITHLRYRYSRTYYITEINGVHFWYDGPHLNLQEPTQAHKSCVVVASLGHEPSLLVCKSPVYTSCIRSLLWIHAEQPVEYLMSWSTIWTEVNVTLQAPWLFKSHTRQSIACLDCWATLPTWNQCLYMYFVLILARLYCWN